jgi:ATP-dependent RNA helicase DeaD
VHKFALDHILKLKSILIISPAGLGRGSSTMIGILNSIDLSDQSTQAIVLSPSKDLAKEFYSELNNLKGTLKISTYLCSAGERLDHLQLKSQILVATGGVLLRLSKDRKIDLNHLKVIVCDIANKLFKDPMIQDTEQFLNLIHRPCTYWYLSPKEENNIKEKFLARVGDFPILEIKDDEKPIEDFRFYYKKVENDEEQLDFIKSISFHHSNQIIIYSHDLQKLKMIENELKDYSSALISTSYSKYHQNTVISDFRDEVLKVLLCESKLSLLRKIKAREKVDLIFLDASKDNETFMMRLRRFDYKQLDEVYFVFQEDHLPKLYQFIQNYNLEVETY